MARAVARTVEESATLVAEAGTGTGKTFAYLVPALLWGGKVIISTGTRHLQDQLFLRDIPTVRKALNAPVTVALLKGRSNYVCRLYLLRTMEQGTFSVSEETRQLRAIARFAKTSTSGDRSELAGVPDNSPIWHRVTSSHENCPGAECAYYQDCFVMKARRKALQSDVLVVNHHLLFADLTLKESGISELLPTANTIIFDEAHQLPDTATLFLGEIVSTSHVFDLCRDVLVEGLAHARDGTEWGKIVSALEKEARDLRLVFSEDYVKLSVGQLDRNTPLFPALNSLLDALRALISVLNAHADATELLALYATRAQSLAEAFHAWHTAAQGSSDMAYVMWVEAFANSLQLHKTPLSVASTFTQQRKARSCAWIFTSATLAIRGNFHHFSSRLGLENAHAKVWASPFDYASQGVLYVPDITARPNTPDFSATVAQIALPLIEAAGGKAFLLCTTLRAVNLIATYLREEFERNHWDFPLFVQGDSPRTDLLERFRAAGNGVLVGSQSFWEGVDVRGEGLSLVIVDKLPFAPPDDPVLSARIQLLESEGKNGFMDYQLPEAIMNLKQGAGRLIRDESDRGVLVICDTRLVSSRYGRRIWQSLPPFLRTRSMEEACRFFSGSANLQGLPPPSAQEAQCHTRTDEDNA
ncbi:MAG: ATP-dependent DNA helicase [Burkholderiaceae bacterium]|nr:ATP-dependent DNA helicase [Burkholderiaceae bacterium]